MALIGGQLFLLVIFMLVVKPSVPPSLQVDLTNPQFLAGLMVFAVMFPVAQMLYRKRANEGRKSKDPLVEKTAHYRVSTMLRLAMIEGANLICVMFYFLTANYFFLIPFALGLLLFVQFRPSRQGFAEDYQLSASERSELRANP